MSKPNKHTKTTVRSITFTPGECRAWVLPPYQRQAYDNARIRELSEEMALNGGVIPGVISFAVVDGETYLNNGQQRRVAFLMSGKPHGYADVQTTWFASMRDAADAYVELQRNLVPTRTDDTLRALEHTKTVLRDIRDACPFAGYDRLRSRVGGMPIVSISMLVRAWYVSLTESPGYSGGAIVRIVERMEDKSLLAVVPFLKLAYEAWGADEDYRRMWSMLNLTLCMWLYHRIVEGQAKSEVTGQKRHTVITPKLFQKCLASLSANAKYLEWLTGRNLTDIHRSPAYGRIKNLFGRIMAEELRKTPKLPAPDWFKGGGARRDQL